MKTPVNVRTIRQHLTYSWWKYALLIVLGALAVNLYFTVTVYRPPESRKVLLYVYGLADEEGLNAYLEDVHREQMPEMEEMGSLILSTDGTYGPMQLTTYVAAGEGDIYLLPRDQFIQMASSGTWVPLEEEEDLISLFTERDLSLQSGWRRLSDTGESHLFGIPLSRLPGLSRYVAVENGYLAVLVTNGNDENVLRFLRILCQDMLDAPENTAPAADAPSPAAPSEDPAASSEK